MQVYKHSNFELATMGKQQERGNCIDFTMDCAITLETLGIYFRCYPALTSTVFK